MPIRQRDHHRAVAQRATAAKAGGDRLEADLEILQSVLSPDGSPDGPERRAMDDSSARRDRERSWEQGAIDVTGLQLDGRVSEDAPHLPRLRTRREADPDLGVIRPSGGQPDDPDRRVFRTPVARPGGEADVTLVRQVAVQRAPDLVVTRWRIQ